mmetsp:Transcript_8929/g.27727  ORF Transcript_8929/g.27727 Transcript_8929/m.27727 type:complete len:274 (-) Transcript_8929:228-1049(-)
MNLAERLRSPAQPGGPASFCAMVSLHLRGLLHFVGDPQLWRKMIAPICVTLFSTLASFTLLISFALKPQVRLFDDRWGWPSWVAWPVAVLLVLAEGAVVNMVLFLVLFGCTQSQLLRAVLEERGVLPRIRAERGEEELPEALCCRDVAHSLVFLSARLPLMLVTLPLHGFPVLGQIAWCLLNGWLYSWELLAEFMVMYEERHGCGEQWLFVRRRFASFTYFGAVAMGLELIPFAGPWIFFASNACGAAYLAEVIFKERHVLIDGEWHTLDAVS